MSATGGNRIRWAVVLGLLGLLLVFPLGLTACGGGAESTVTTMAPASEPFPAKGAPDVATEDGGRAGVGGEAQVAQVPPGDEAGGSIVPQPVGTLGTATAGLDRKMVSNATLTVQVERDKFSVAFDQALQLADKYGGYVVTSQSHASAEEGVLRNGTVTLRVPATSFTQALRDASALGKVQTRQIDSQDVTEEYVDLEARLENDRVQEKALQDLLTQAKNVNEVLQVRNVLTNLQQEMEQIQGRLKYLDEHTSFSTLTISVFEEGEQVAATGSGWGFTNALRDSVYAFVQTLNGMIVGLGGALPVLILLAVAAYVIWRVVRSAGRPRTAPVVGAPPAPAEEPPDGDPTR